MKYPLLLTTLLRVLFGQLCAGPAKPNIIFILADDLGLDGLSC